MLFCIAYGKLCNFKAPMPAPMRDLLQRSARGWVQSRINEKGNKVIRDAETRNQASKAFFYMHICDTCICIIRVLASFVCAF